MDEYINPNSSNRKVTVSCRVLPEQKLLIAEKANKMGMSTSQYLEAKVLREDTFSLEDKIENQGHEIQSLKSQLTKVHQDLQGKEKDFAKLLQDEENLLEHLNNVEAIAEENKRLRSKIEELEQEKESDQKEESEIFDFPKFKWWMILIPIGLILLIYFIFGRTGQQNAVAVVRPVNPYGNFLQ